MDDQFNTFLAFEVSAKAEITSPFLLELISYSIFLPLNMPLKEFEKVGNLITKVIKGLSENPEDNSKVENEVRNEVINLCSNFPIYKNLNK